MQKYPEELVELLLEIDQKIVQARIMQEPWLLLNKSIIKIIKSVEPHGASTPMGQEMLTYQAMQSRINFLSYKDLITTYQTDKKILIADWNEMDGDIQDLLT